jgi:hypothetical protein
MRRQNRPSRRARQRLKKRARAMVKARCLYCRRRPDLDFRWDTQHRPICSRCLNN